MLLRVLAIETSASCSRPARAMIAPSRSGSTLEPSARSAALVSVTVRIEERSTAPLPPARAERSALWKSTSLRW